MEGLRAVILDLRLGRLWEERRASAGGSSCREIFQSYLRVASPSLFLFSRHDQALDQRIHYGAARQTFEQRQLWPSQLKKLVARAERSNEPSTTARQQTD